MKIDISERTEILVFTGPESSGKTTSAERISNLYHLPLVAEYAREYLNRNGPSYTFNDIQRIAEKQIEQEGEANQNHPLIICDTDLVTLEIWALEKYGKSLHLNDARSTKKHYLLCYPDIPWEPDPLRENPSDRVRLFDVYQSYLNDINASFTVLNENNRNCLQLI